MLLHSQNAQMRKTGGKQTKKETDLKKKKNSAIYLVLQQKHIPLVETIFSEAWSM